MTLVRVEIHVAGLVQGVGFRPFVWHVAHQLACTGWVRNSAGGVEIELQGSAEAIGHFMDRLRQQPPPLAQVLSIAHRAIDLLENESDFRIVLSDLNSQPWALVSPDISVCQDCLAELMDRSNRRFRYPFINCTNCGPRFTIQQSVPYDRQHTTMRQFVMCASCQAEYESTVSRRFHAQPNACPECGPTIRYYLSKEAAELAAQVAGNTENAWQVASANSDLVIKKVRSDIQAGLVVAIKGVGGFHLACDATQAGAVQRLRERKRRPFKPLAVMVGDISTAAKLVHITPLERGLLMSHQRPIVLLPKRRECLLPDEVAPNDPFLGVMLPYSPLHYLLMKDEDIWVMTSGNLSEEPIAYEDQDAIDRLGQIADSFLLHNRPIHTVCDDSVIRAAALEPLPIRRSRGYAPLPVRLGHEGPPVLAIGGELKTAICLAIGDHAYMGQHIGDMGNPETMLALEQSCLHLQSLYRTSASAYVGDQHPGYLSSDWAQKRAKQNKIPFIQVQHHHAHAASLIADNQHPSDEAIIACVLDGTGYGEDGNIWGGEILIADACSYRRVAHLQYAPLPGGDRCIRQPARTALAYLYGAEITWHDELQCRSYFSEPDLNLLRQQLQKQINVVQTSSMGRLFDAVASLLGLRHSIDYEGQAASELEALAETAVRGGASESVPGYAFPWSSSKPSQLNYGPLLSAICAELQKGADLAMVALKFHVAVARAFTEQCLRVQADELAMSKGRKLDCVGLTGGVFQNTLLLRLMQDCLTREGFRVLTHSVVPPNDGGLALGQALIGRERLKRSMI